MADMSRRSQQAVVNARETVLNGASEAGRVGRRIVKMIWDPEPVNDRAANKPVWCLGCSYAHEPADRTNPVSDPSASSCTAVDAVSDASAHSSSSSPSSALACEASYEDRGWPPAFLSDFESRIWMTYRSNFEPIARSADTTSSALLSLAIRLRTLTDQNGFSSDTGWGCMIRSGQSLLANTLLICHLGRGWRRGTADHAEREILARFADDPRAPYSIHNFVRHGALACGKYPGEWFGPSATARCIQALASSNETLLRVYSTGDQPDVYEDSFMAIAKPDGATFYPTLILVGTRLGIDKVNQVYWESLTATLQLPQSMGICGGRPSQSHYFVGAQQSDDVSEPGSYLFYLDPHLTRPALPFHENLDEYSDEDIDSCHTRRLRKLHIREMDPSMLIGFLIRDEDEWDTWKNSIQYVQGKAVVRVSEHDPARGFPTEREGAIDEVETLSDEEDAESAL